MQYFPNHGYGIHRVIYTSRALAAMEQGEFAELVAQSAVKNRAKAVTGALLAYDGWFIQVLEGGHDSVKPLFERIAADPRHEAVVLRAVDPAVSRLFARWGMKEGMRPLGVGQGLDIAAMSPDDLLALLKLSVLKPVARAA